MCSQTDKQTDKFRRLKSSENLIVPFSHQTICPSRRFVHPLVKKWPISERNRVSSLQAPSSQNPIVSHRLGRYTFHPTTFFSVRYIFYLLTVLTLRITVQGCINVCTLFKVARTYLLELIGVLVTFFNRAF